jgi:hypothetical protein
MKRYKTVARILIILSVVKFTFAGPAQPRAMHEARAHLVKMGLANASEKRYEPLEKLSEESNKWSTAGHAHPRMDPGTAPDLAPDDAESNPDDKKFLSEEFKGELREDSIYTVVGVVVAGLVSNFRSEITTPADPGSYVFASSLLLPTL